MHIAQYWYHNYHRSTSSSFNYFGQHLHFVHPNYHPCDRGHVTAIVMIQLCSWFGQQAVKQKYSKDSTNQNFYSMVPCLVKAVTFTPRKPIHMEPPVSEIGFRLQRGLGGQRGGWAMKGAQLISLPTILSDSLSDEHHISSSPLPPHQHINSNHHKDSTD